MSEAALQDSEAFRQRVLSNGLLDAETMGEAVRGFTDEGEGGKNFPSYLLHKGLLSLSQFNELTDTNVVPLHDRGTRKLEEPLDPRVGGVYEGFKVGELLARGGMGAVYYGTRLEDELPVVVKFLAQHLAQNDGLRRRFRREGEVLERLPDHENVVGVLGLCPEDHPEPYLVMEFVDGLSLERVLAERWSLPWQEAVSIAVQVADGLAAAHDHGIFHRDVKPANVLVTRENVVKLVDFGLAKDTFATTLTRPGTRLGTPYYMAPEQWGNNDMDARCDVFSLGATLYHLLVGEPPFLGKDAAEVGRKIMSGDFSPPRRVEPSIPVEVEEVICQMLQPERRFRYPRIKGCAEDLRRSLRGESPRVPTLTEVGGERPVRHALLPGREFLIGREPDCDLRLVDPTVSRRHARLRRGQNGFVLRDQESTYGTYLGSMRVKRPLVLRSGDRLRVGKVKLLFRDPWAEQCGVTTSGGLQRREVPAPVLQAMASAGDMRVTLGLIERLAPDPVDDERAEFELTELLGDELGGEIYARRQMLATRSRARLPQRLQSLTGEDGGRDPNEWLDVWERIAENQPIQYGIERPPRSYHLDVISGEEGSSELGLEADEVAIGRDEDCTIQLSHRTVSRRHATISRLHRRLVIADAGSRLGVKLNSQRVTRSFLTSGDMIELGDVQLKLVVDPGHGGPTRVGIDLYAIDPLSFQVLHERKHPSVVTALIGFLHESRRLQWLAKLAGELYPKAGDRASQIVESVKRIYVRHAEEALDLLPELLGSDVENPESSRQSARLSNWSQALAKRRSELGPQVIPVGWLAASRNLWSSEDDE